MRAFEDKEGFEGKRRIEEGEGWRVSASSLRCCRRGIVCVSVVCKNGGRRKHMHLFVLAVPFARFLLEGLFVISINGICFHLKNCFVYPFGCCVNI